MKRRLRSDGGRSGGGDRNYVSVWFWLFALFVMAIPCLGVVMAIVWALVGDNASRKNYFRALIIWALLLTFLWIGVMAAGFSPVVVKVIQDAWKRVW